MFRFANQQMLYLIALVVCLPLLFYIFDRYAKGLLERFATGKLLSVIIDSVNWRSRRIKRVLFTAGLFFLVLALARPQFGTKIEEVKRKGMNLVVVLDVSNSMLAEDVKPNRLTRSKIEVSSIIDKLKGDRIGIVLFAGEAFPYCPLTLDYEAAKMLLSGADTRSISAQGTNIAAGIDKAIEMFPKREKKHLAILVITDGENLEGNPEEAAKRAAEQGVKIFTVGIGSPAGEPIPTYNESGQKTGYKRNEDGSIVTSKLDEKSLQKIALITDGKYYRASPGQAELDKIFSEIEKIGTEEFASKKFTTYEDRYRYPLALSGLLLLASFLSNDRKKRRKQ